MTTAPTIGVIADTTAGQMVFTCTPNVVVDDGVQVTFKVL